VSETKHTAGPWKVSPLVPSAIDTVEPSFGRHVATCYGSSPDANARRIVACVNACEGFPTDALESLARHAPFTDFANMEQRCADLLRALKDLREQVDAHVVICGVSHFNTRLATEVIDRIEK
jgi:hypothetical protein